MEASWCSINWGTLPEWPAAIAAVASAGVVIWFAGLNRTYLKEASRQYQRENREAGLRDSDLVQGFFHRASRAIENALRILQGDKPPYPEESTEHPNDVFKACVLAARIAPSMDTAAEKVFDRSIYVALKKKTIEELPVEERTPRDFDELNQAGVAFNAMAEEFMKQFRKELSVE